MTLYNPQKTEKKWQKYWVEKEIYKTKEDKTKPKYYILDMFPYPSGSGLHVGHPKGYIATDVVARMKMMQGHSVLHPMGWDAFGLPAENFALKNKVHPEEATNKNIATFKRQLGLLGFTYDWDREVTTTDPKYYKWTQWIFLQMFKQGLAYESFEPINWCPSCQTGLANEDLEDGKCERCGSVVERKPVRQWVLKITKYADRLLNDIDNLTNWPEPIKEMQRNWIGRSEGAEIDFAIKGTDLKITVFTTRPDTLFGATYCVIAPEHALISNKQLAISNRDEINAYVEQAKHKSDLERTELQKDKTGVEIKGIKAINPVNGEELPIFIADYVLGGYGTGAIMAVPAHDERDFEFAKKYGLPIREVVAKQLGERLENSTFRRTVRCVCIRDGKIPVIYDIKMAEYLLPGGGIEEGEDPVTALKREVQEELGYGEIEIKQSLGTIEHNYYHTYKKSNWRSECFAFAVEVSDKHLGMRSADDQRKAEVQWLSIDEAYDKLKNSKTFSREVEFIERLRSGTSVLFPGDGIATNSGFLDGLTTREAKEKIIQNLEERGLGNRKVQYKLRDWVFSRQRYWGEPIPLVHCEKCGWVAVPEDQLPVELPKVKHYEPTGTGESPLANITDWVNTTCPECGGPGKRETNTMPQWAGSSWYYLRYIDPHNDKELVNKEKEKYWSPIDFYVGGAEHATRHLIYARFWHKFLYDIGVVNYIEPFTRLQSVGLILAEDGRKMSKRWNNVVNPDDVVEQYGADAMRVYEMFMGPFAQACAWSTNGVVGARRFLDKVWNLQEKVSETPPQPPLERGGSVDTPPFKEGSARRPGVVSPVRTTMLLHQTIKKVTEDIEEMRFNTAIAKMMELVNEMNKEEAISPTTYRLFVQVLSPFAPHLSEELWNILGNEGSIFTAPWPVYDPALAKADEFTLAVQINGKIRDTIIVPAEISEDEAKKTALASEKVQKWLEGKEPKKVIYVKGKLISIVI